MKTLYLQEMMKEEMRAERELARNSQDFAIFLDSRIGTDVRRLLHDKLEYGKAMSNKDVLGMWQAIKMVATNSISEAYSKRQAQTDFECYKQARLTFEEYCIGFDQKRGVCGRVGKVYEEEDAVRLFNNGLSYKVYGTKLRELEFDEARGIPMPSTVSDMCQLIRSLNQTVLKRELEVIGSKPVEHANPARNDRQMTKTKTSMDPERLKTMKCHRCGKLGHLIRECRQEQKRAPEPQPSSKPNVYKKGKPTTKKTEKANAAVQNDESDEDEVKTGGCMMTGIVEESERVSVKLNLDTGASSHFVKDVELLTDIQDIDPIEVRGIVGKTKITKTGKLEPFGKAFYLPGGNINILSCSKLVSDGFNVEMDCVNNKFVVRQDHENAWDFLRNRNGLYSMELMVGGIGVVEEDAGAAENISEAQQERSKKVLELQASLGYPSDSYFSRALEHGVIAGCDSQGS